MTSLQTQDPRDTPMAEGDAHRDGSRTAAVYLLALLHEARRAQSPTSPVNHRHPTVAPDDLNREPPTSKRGDPFEEAKFEEAKTWPSLPSLHQVHALFDAVACATNTHPDPSRVPPLVTAAMTLLSRASAGQSRHPSPGLPPISWLGAEPWPPQALWRRRSVRRCCCLGPCRCAAWLENARALRLQLAAAAALGPQHRLQIHGRRPPLLHSAHQDVRQPRAQVASPHCPSRAPCAPPQGAPGRPGCPTPSRTS